jgi:hypothetical protein
VDEIRFYDRALHIEELQACHRRPGVVAGSLKPVRSWEFRKDGQASEKKLRGGWKAGALSVKLTGATGQAQAGKVFGEVDSEWQSVSLVLDPVTLEKLESGDAVQVEAAVVDGGALPAVTYDHALGWHRVNLDGIEPTVPAGRTRNDSLERIKVLVSNGSEDEQVARLMFEKTRGGIRQRTGSAITGVSAVLRDEEGRPTGIPVQLSKNWHTKKEGGVYAGQWFHGITRLRLPPRSQANLELTICYGHWGGVAAASHAQLSLIGWGSNQLWEQSALGAWGESICFEPDRGQAQCLITDVRPLMVAGKGSGKQWGWTHNVGGGDVFRVFDEEGRRIFPSGMRTIRHRQGPCLTEVTYEGRLGSWIRHATTVSLSRTDDLLRGTYQLRMDVEEAMACSRFVLFQVGADTYNFTRERRLAVGDAEGLGREWEADWGGNRYRGQPIALSGAMPWVSLHEGERGERDGGGAWANRGYVIRDWKARLGGKAAEPWVAERGLERHGRESSTMDLVLPPGVTRLLPGDYVEATIEHLTVPQKATDYYGPNEELREALEKHGNTWRMVHREAAGNARRVEVGQGELIRRHPDVRVKANGDGAAFSVQGGVGYVPVTVTGLASHAGYALTVNGEAVEQGVHGNDYWQTDYDPKRKTWSRTYNLPMREGVSYQIQLINKP